MSAPGHRVTRLLLAVALTAAPPLAPLIAQQPAPAALVLEVRDAGPGDAGRLLVELLAGPHVALVPAAPAVELRRDTTYATTVVVVGADATVASRVQGDVVVVGGNLYLHPGAEIAGRAVAVGGGVYNSTLATAAGGLHAFRDETFTAERDGGTLALAHRRLDVQEAPWLTWPGLYGVRIPGYTRVDGLVLTAGPRLHLARAGVEVEPTLTYRSHLGALDPRLALRRTFGRRTDVELVGERATYTNDAWARLELVNAGLTLLRGDDERNYYRATRVGGRVTRRYEGFNGMVEPWVGAQTEDARSVGPRPGATSAPWTVLSRGDTMNILRPNPAVLDGRITSALAGARAEWDDGDLTARGALRLEMPVDAVRDLRFVQLTLDASSTFPTVRDHSLELEAHAVLTAGDSAPPQRFAYLGGGGTIPTLDELTMGGDQLLFVEGTYLVPLPRPVLPYVGPPVIGLRYIAGSAGVRRLPAFVQNVGALVRFTPVEFDVLVDPATGDVNVGFGVAFGFD